MEEESKRRYQQKVDEMRARREPVSSFALCFTSHMLTFMMKVSNTAPNLESIKEELRKELDVQYSGRFDEVVGEVKAKYQSELREVIEQKVSSA